MQESKILQCYEEELFMKKLFKLGTIFLLVISIFSILSACSKSTGDDKDQSTQTVSEQKTSPISNEDKSNNQSDEQTKNLKWPEEFDKWGVPTIKDATVSLADNRSATQEGMQQGLTAIVNLKKLAKKDFDTYCKDLEGNGFINNPNALGDVMMEYTKKINGGEIKLTLSYTEDTTTIIATNSKAAQLKESEPAKKANWPDSCKGIPEFTKGTYKETIEMGGGMYQITYTGVSESDIEWYRNELKKSGFAGQKSEDTEGYGKVNGSNGYSVGFSQNGDTLLLILMSSSI